MPRLFVIASFLAAAAGCSLGDDAHCDFTDKGTGKVKRCQERLGTVQASAFKATGGAAGGTCADGPCARAGAVGGCELGTQGDGSKVNDWYYAPTTAADAMKTCSDEKGKFLTP